MCPSIDSTSCSNPKKNQIAHDTTKNYSYPVDKIPI